MGLNLKEPIGPLPLGAWIAVVGGGLGISWYSRRHTAAAPAVTAAAPVSDGAGTFGPGGVGDVGGGSSGPPPGPVAPAPATNEEWGHLAVLTLLGHGFDPITADRAVGDYLAGHALDASEKADIDAVLRYIGPPPIPLPPVAPAPPGGSGAPPPSQVVPPSSPLSDFIAGLGSGHADVLASIQSQGIIPANTIPVYAKPGTTGPEKLPPIRVLPYGAAVVTIGPPIPGPWPGSPGALFFPIQGGGYVAASDIAGRSPVGV